MRRVLLLLGLAACSSSPTTPASDGGGDDGTTPVIEGGTGCSLDKSPKEDKCVFDETYGVFVSASLGSPMGDGSRAKPLQTIQAGIDLAKTTKRNVYVCSEQYAEQINVANAVHMYGYFDCKNGWAPVDTRAVVSPTAIPVVRADGAQQTTRIEGFDVRAPSMPMPQASSIAVVLVASSGIRFASMTIHSGDAGSGMGGMNGVQLTDSGGAKNGAPAQPGYSCNVMTFSCTSGPATFATQNACTGKPNINGGTGGGGGKPSKYTYNNGVWSLVQSPTDGAAQPATQSTAKGGVVGGAGAIQGAAGMNGTNGVPGNDIGAIDPVKLFVNASGTPGSDGQPGQGGGGGAGYDLNPGNSAGTNGATFWGGAGGAGGAGGCPGLAAQEGTGGGASIGILAIDSPFTIDASTITTGLGGSGGAAGVAGTSTLGGSGGTANGFVQGGANGGTGGVAGASGNGAGGPSIGIAYKGVTPVVMTGAVITPGQGGAGVAARVLIDLAAIPASPSGRSAALVSY